MHYLPRTTINERLRLARRQSFRLLPPTGHRLGLIPSSLIVEMLNRAADGEDSVTDIPCDLATPGEIAAETGLSAHRIALATRRVKAPLPSYRLNNWTIRIRRGTFEKWLARGSRNMGK